MEDGETAEQFVTALPPRRFQPSLRYTSSHEFAVGQRVVLLSLTAAGWIDSGFTGTILSIEAKSRAGKRNIRRAQVEWDEGYSHPSRIGFHALSRLRPLTYVERPVSVLHP